MDLKIVPLVSDRPIAPTEISVAIPPQYIDYVKTLVKEVGKINQISTPGDLQTVLDAQGRVQATLAQIESERKAAKTPILSLENAIDSAASSLSLPLEEQKDKFDKLLEGAAAAKQAKQDALVREAHENHRRRIEAQEAEILRLEQEKQKAAISARSAEDLEQAAAARTLAKELEIAALDARYELEMVKETQVIEPKFEGPLIPGARSPQNIDLDLVNERLFLSQVDKNGKVDTDRILQMADITLKRQVVKDIVKTLRKANRDNPDFDIVSLFASIGIALKIYRKPNVKQAAKVIHD